MTPFCRALVDHLLELTNTIEKSADDAGEMWWPASIDNEVYAVTKHLSKLGVCIPCHPRQYAKTLDAMRRTGYKGSVLAFITMATKEYTTKYLADKAGQADADIPPAT